MPVNRKQFNKSIKNNQTGGSPASDMVGAQANQKALTEVVPEACPLKGDMNSLSLYKTTGGGSCGSTNNMYKAKGGRRHRKSHRKTHSKTHRKTHSKSHRKTHRKSNRKTRRSTRRSRSMKGGGSDWIMSQYSQGNINAPESDMWKQFSGSAPSARNNLMNPPTLGLAGSGSPMSGLEGANVRSVGSPLV
jgi:hypothetical protein